MSFTFFFWLVFDVKRALLLKEISQEVPEMWASVLRAGVVEKASAHLQQLRHDGQNLWVADVDGIIPVGLFLVADVSQVEDGWQQGEDPDGKQRHQS